MGEEETAEVEVLGALDELLDLRLVEVSGREGLGGGEVGAEGAVEGRSFVSMPLAEEESRKRGCAPVVASNDDSAGTGRLVLDDLVSRVETLLLVGSAKLVGERVGTDGTEVDGRVVGEDVLQ